MINETAKKFFDKNPKAKEAYIVLNQAFGDAETAQKYRAAMHAREVSVVKKNQRSGISDQESGVMSDDGSTSSP